MKMRLIILSGLLLSIFCGTARSQTTAFGDGEQLTFVVSYKASLVPNTEVAQVVLKTSSATVSGKPTWHIYVNARVFQFFRWFYDLDDTYETWLDKGNMKPLKYVNRTKENKSVRSSEYAYNWNTMKVTTTYRNQKRPDPVIRTVDLKSKSYDALALFYNLRCEDPSSFIAGAGRSLELVLDDCVRRINYKFLKRETKTIRGLGTFNTLKFSCQLATSTGENFKDGSEFFLWISDDENKIPLYIELPIRVGSVVGKLSKYEGLKYDLKSKVK